MKRYRVYAGTAAPALVACVAVSSPAAAITATASCSVDGHNNNDSATYVVSGAYHQWRAAYYKFSGGSTGDKSNMIIRLRANGADKWAWDSPDNRSNGVQYGQKMDNALTLASATEYVLFRAIFDVPGTDPACNAYTSNL